MNKEDIIGEFLIGGLIEKGKRHLKKSDIASGKGRTSDANEHLRRAIQDGIRACDLLPPTENELRESMGSRPIYRADSQSVQD